MQIILVEYFTATSSWCRLTIVEAFNQGKGVKALYSNTPSYSSYSSYIYIFDLVTRPTGSNTLYFAANNTNLDVSDLGAIKYYIYITSTNAWSTGRTYYNSISSSLQQTSATTPLSSGVRYHRPILTSTNPPSSTDGRVGDIWVVYNNE